MPSGPKKRKAAKKKKIKDSNSSSSSSTIHSHPGESDAGELGSPATQDQQNESISLGSGEKIEKEDESIIEIDKVSKPLKSHNSSSSSGSHSSDDDESHVFEKNVVVFESAPLLEKKSHEVEDSAVETSFVLDSVKPADSLLKEEIVEEKSSVPEFNKKTFVEQMTVGNGSDMNDNCLVFSEVVESSSIEKPAAKPSSPEENAHSEPRENTAASTFNGVARVNESETLQDSDKQPLVASAAPKAVQTTSWKGCCGILELFSSSDR